MKRTKLFSSVVLAGAFVALVVTGCKKNNDGGGGTSISATVDATAWQSQYVNGFKSGGETNLVGYYGKSGDTSIISIQVHDSVKVNEVTPFDILTNVTYTKSDGTQYIAESYTGAHGTVTVTSWDKNADKIAGTFSGVLYNSNDWDDSIKIDNGHFSSTYIVY
ncbi:MAG TPA: hypothetical protein VHD83_26820 [Puia sp.]|nr:hypothetical protein [Puia sp.]